MGLMVVLVACLAWMGCGEVIRMPLYRTNGVSATTRYPTPPFTMHVEGNAHGSPLFGGITSVGEYYANVKLGGEDARVQIDTGSGTLAVPMDTCKSCKKTSRRYSLSKSNSERASMVGCASNKCQKRADCPVICKVCGAENQCCASQDSKYCAFALRYGDGSGAEGALVEDELEWGGITVPVTFGGIMNDTNDFERAEVDGILGMGFKPLACNPSCITPVFDAMVEHKVVDEEIFAMCMNNDGGMIVLGGTDPTMNTSEPVYEPLRPASIPGEYKFYEVGLTNEVIVGDVALKLDGLRTAIVDSGTTLIAVKDSVFNGIVAQLKRAHCEVPGLCASNSWFAPQRCVQLDDESINMLPTITFPLEHGTMIEMRPQEYMLYYKQNGVSLRCVGFMTLSLSIDIIFGNTLNMRYMTIYDRKADPPRIGFADKSKTCGSATAPSSICSTWSSCGDCKSDSNCVYNYKTSACSSRAEHGSIIPYPYCHGVTCFCSAERYIPAAAAIGGGALIGVTIAAAMLAVVTWRRRRRESYDAVYEEF